MDDNDWGLSAIVTSCNANRPNNVLVPTFGNDHDDWFSRLLDDDHMINFDGLGGGFFSSDFPVAHQQNPDDQSYEIIQPTPPVDPMSADLSCADSSFSMLNPSRIHQTYTTFGESDMHPLTSLNNPSNMADDQVQIMDQNDYQLLQSTQLSQQIILPPLSPPPPPVPAPTALDYVPDPTTLVYEPAAPTALAYMPEPTELAYVPEPTALAYVPEPTALAYEPAAPTELAYVPAAAPQELIYPQQQQQLADVVTSTPVIKTHRWKNQSWIKTIYELKQEELHDDKWAWRKYGQKPIRSSPYPRNYYRCSTLKSCIAKKYIEKSPKGGDLFLVGYSGDHSHPAPSNKSCYAGFARVSKYKLPKGISVVPRVLSSSRRPRGRPRSNASKISATTPTLEIGSASLNNNEMVAVAENKAGEEEENVLLIPKEIANEDILKSSEELNGITAASTLMG